MFGTFARMRVKKGMGSKLVETSRSVESRHADGGMSTNIFHSRHDPEEYWIAVVFRDELSYKMNAADPAQQQWFGDIRELLDSEMEWRDGEVVHSAHTH